jgi:pimeloyl-ACP methyl ester carboxylesterase
MSPPAIQADRPQCIVWRQLNREGHMLNWRRVPRPLLAVTVLVLGLAGCGGGNKAASTTASAPALSDEQSCSGMLSQARPATFGPDAGLSGVLLGSGHVGLVLAHEFGADHCQWAVYALQQAKAGYQVMLFDFAGNGDSAPNGTANDAAVVAAADYLRSHGAQTMVLIGASMGGTAVLSAATKITPPVAGVISLSGPAGFGGVSALTAVPQLAVPVLYAACALDDTFGDDAKTMYEATPPSVSRTLAVQPMCAHHGIQLTIPTTGSDATAVIAAMKDFLAAHAPA